MIDRPSLDGNGPSTSQVRSRLLLRAVGDNRVRDRTRESSASGVLCEAPVRGFPLWAPSAPRRSSRWCGGRPGSVATRSIQLRRVNGTTSPVPSLMEWQGARVGQDGWHRVPPKDAHEVGVEVPSDGTRR